MKIKIKHKKLEDLPCKKRQKILSEFGDYDFYYLDEESYTVYGISFWNGTPMYQICEDPTDEYTVPKPADFFEIVDDRLSKYWVLSIYMGEDGETMPELVFPEWRDQPHFNEKLLDGEPAAEAIFVKYKKLMDEEFKENEQ